MCQYLETIAILNGKPQHLNFNQKRVSENGSLDLQKYLNTLSFPSSELLKLSIIYDPTKFLSATVTPYSPRKILTFKIIHNNKIDYCKKYADRSEIDAMVLQKGSCDEILIVKNGLITDTSFSNIVFKKGSRWITPKTPLLQGTCRARLIENGIIEVQDVEISDLEQCSHFMLINAMLDFDEKRAYPIDKETFIL